ncbi:MAG: tannase/feruloyl esterase family alpha/beta hydrolase [Clostridia bacterium]|nr:tannase/feruloyl esterase family alpha/beta hydrolase [Clostridia bacterium]
MIKTVDNFDKKIEKYLSKQRHITNYKLQLATDVLDVECYDVKFPVTSDVLRVHLELSFEKGSFVVTEVWLPVEAQNIFVAHGGGGMAGWVPIHDMYNLLQKGYITAGTDMGTSKGEEWGINNKACYKDFGYRAICHMSKIARKLIKIAYGNQKIISIFKGGSTGGHQALTVIQRVPKLYDGVLCGAPANLRIPLHNYFLWNFVNCKEAQFSKETAQMIQQKACETNLLPEEFVSTLDFLNDIQKEKLINIYKGPFGNYCGMPMGSETETCGLDYMSNANIKPHFYPFIWAFGKDFDPFSYDFKQDYKKVKQTLSKYMDADKTNLTPFFKKGGKLLIVAGTYDCTVPYQKTLDYVKEVAEYSKNARENLKLFIVPMVNHDIAFCRTEDVTAKDGTSLLDALILWVKDGHIPETVYGVKCGKYIKPTEL